MVSEFLSLLACLTLSVCALASLPSSSGSNIGSYAYIGCWAEPLSGAVRALVGAFYADDAMTLEQCSSNCAGAYQYWGVEYGRECYCSNQLSAGTLPAPGTDCSFPCAGSANEICGAGNRLSVYNATTPVIPYIPMIGQYTFVGCQAEAAGGVRALQGLSVAAANMTTEFCASICTGFKMFGTEYGDECFCGDTLTPGSVAAPIADCNFQCAGNPLELCGAPLRLNLYSIMPSSSSSLFTLIRTSSPSALSSSSSSSSFLSPSTSTWTSSPSGPLSSSSLLSSSKSSSKSTSSSSISSYASVLTSSSSLTSLITVSKTSSAFPTQSWSTTSTPFSPLSSSPASTLNLLPKISSSSGFVTSSSSLSASSTDRSTSSSAPSSILNLLPNILSSSSSVSSSGSQSGTSTSQSASFITKAFSAESSQTSSPTATSSHTPSATDEWKYIGCFQDVDGHQMKNIVRTNEMTPEYCVSAAEARLTAVPATTYHYVGVEYGRECYGATAAPSAPTSLIGGKACTMTCKGNERHGAVDTCGGRMQYNLYASITGSVFSGPVPTMTPNR